MVCTNPHMSPSPMSLTPAGSERASAHEGLQPASAATPFNTKGAARAGRGRAQQETANINTSLLTLGIIMRGLANGVSREQLAGPFRSSALTCLLKVGMGGGVCVCVREERGQGTRHRRAVHVQPETSIADPRPRGAASPSYTQATPPAPLLMPDPLSGLQDALGGNSKTVLIVNVHNDADKLDQIAASLQFADTATRIRNTVGAGHEQARCMPWAECTSRGCAWCVACMHACEGM